MQRKPSDLIARNSVLIWIGLATTVALLIPYVAMRFTTEVRWDKPDFIVMGALLFGSAGFFVLAARKVRRNRRWSIGMASLAAFLYLWVELAVGIFLNHGA